MGKKGVSTEALIESLATLDPKEAKKQRRLIRNRLSAQQHRERQRAYMTGLQKQVAALTAERDAWRDALDALTVKTCVTSGATPEDVLGDLHLPIPAERTAPAPPPPTGQASRSADSGDVMADLLVKARSAVLPRGKPAARAAMLEAAARARSTLGLEQVADASQVWAGVEAASGAAALGSHQTRQRTGTASRPRKRRATRPPADGDDSDDTMTTQGTTPVTRSLHRTPALRTTATSSSSSASDDGAWTQQQQQQQDNEEEEEASAQWEAVPTRRSARASSKRAALALSAAVMQSSAADADDDDDEEEESLVAKVEPVTLSQQQAQQGGVVDSVAPLISFQGADAMQAMLAASAPLAAAPSSSSSSSSSALSVAVMPPALSRGLSLLSENPDDDEGGPGAALHDDDDDDDEFDPLRSPPLAPPPLASPPLPASAGLTDALPLLDDPLVADVALPPVSMAFASPPHAAAPVSSSLLAV